MIFIDCRLEFDGADHSLLRSRYNNKPMCTNSTLCKLILKFQVLDFWEAKSIRSFEMSQEKFRVPLPGKIGPGMSATIPNFMPPKSKKFSDEEMSEISFKFQNMYI